MTGHMPGAAGGPVPMPDVARVRCVVCGELKPRRVCERVQLRPRSYAYRCRGCSR